MAVCPELQSQFEVRVDGGIVRVRASGVLSRQVGTGMMECAIARARDAGCSLLFYDLRNALIGERIQQLDDRAQHAKELGVSQHWRIALLCVERDRLVNFLENSAVTNGILLRVFTDEEQALRWLHP